jgi:dihydroorotate dehydrogenase
MNFYKSFFFPFLKRIDPENVHYFITDVLTFIHRIPFLPDILRALFAVDDPKLEREVFGIKFPNPVGLAAGFDKNARWIDELSALGFGFIEIGTVTPKAQPGNDKPRLFRLVKDEAIVNRMGFNNEGSASAAELLKARKSNVIIGGNIGKNKVTPNENALDDYLIAFNDLYPYVDYFVVNVSSPNTPGLRELQDKEPLSRILNALKQLNGQKSVQRPILLKIAPDLTDSQLDDIVDIVDETQIEGIIATNTTIERSPLVSSQEEINMIGAGGLSGKPLTKRSTEVIRYLHQKSGGSFQIIGVGGIHSPEDALEKIAAGASLIQLYSGFIYEGPGLVKKICKAILKQK